MAYLGCCGLADGCSTPFCSSRLMSFFTTFATRSALNLCRLVVGIFRIRNDLSDLGDDCLRVLAVRPVAGLDRGALKYSIDEGFVGLPLRVLHEGVDDGLGLFLLRLAQGLVAVYHEFGVRQPKAFCILVLLGLRRRLLGCLLVALDRQDRLAAEFLVELGLEFV
jgi:hypothetical protein